jgi:uncharacterized protein (DUF58 family)
VVFTVRFWILFAIGGLLALMGLGIPSILWLVALYDGLLFVLLLVDIFTLPRPADLRVERHHEEVLSLGATNLIRLIVSSRAARPLRVRLRDEPPPDCRVDRREFMLAVEPETPVESGYHLTPLYRGEIRFQDAFLRVMGGLGLVMNTYRFSIRSSVKVYPNLIQLREYELLRHRGLLTQLGFRQIRVKGVGTDFESLREYTADDEFRRIDWKATARRGKPIVRDYQTERSQNVMLLLDAGRNMLAEVEGIRKFDTVLNVSLMLAYVATLMDDKVGAMVFGEEIDQFVVPDRGRQQVARLVGAMHACQPRPVEPDYLHAVTYLARRWRKRSLIVMFTDLIDPESSRVVLQALRGLSRRHLCICATVADPRLRRLSQQYPENAESLYTRAVATQVFTDRLTVVRTLQQMGIQVIDAEPETLVQAVVNYYMYVKARGRL